MPPSPELAQNAPDQNPGDAFTTEQANALNSQYADDHKVEHSNPTKG